MVSWFSTSQISFNTKYRCRLDEYILFGYSYVHVLPHVGRQVGFIHPLTHSLARLRNGKERKRTEKNGNEVK